MQTHYFQYDPNLIFNVPDMRVIQLTTIAEATKDIDRSKGAQLYRENSPESRSQFVHADIMRITLDKAYPIANSSVVITVTARVFPIAKEPYVVYSVASTALTSNKKHGFAATVYAQQTSELIDAMQLASQKVLEIKEQLKEDFKKFEADGFEGFTYKRKALSEDEPSSSVKRKPSTSEDA